MAQQVNFNIGDNLEIKILERWVDIAAWKDWVKVATRKEWQDRKVRDIHITAATQIAESVAIVEATPD